MLSAFLTGFILGFSLILVIGAQNSFVLRQGLMGRHVFTVALFCSLSDAILIIIGVAGISIFLNNYINITNSIFFNNLSDGDETEFQITGTSTETLTQGIKQSILDRFN